MGKKSVKENKNIYQLAREECGLTRAQAAEMMPGMTADRIERIESGRTVPAPEDVWAALNADNKVSLYTNVRGEVKIFNKNLGD